MHEAQFVKPAVLLHCVTENPWHLAGAWPSGNSQACQACGTGAAVSKVLMLTLK
jgi:hypothetical protein